ncbi:hypothetical protein ACFE04_025981 [Oxalis oulophora]
MDYDPKRKVICFFFLLLLVLSLLFDGGFSQALFSQKPIKPSNADVASSAVFQIAGNVYPTGYYTVTLLMGNPPRPYDLDIDTGSDLTWVQCDAPCKGCTRPRNQLYVPNANKAIVCSDIACTHATSPEKPKCEKPTDQCHYEIIYADSGSSMGALVKDNIAFKLKNGSAVAPQLAFGCGYDQEYKGPHDPPKTLGVLGLGNGNVSIVSQLQSLGAAKNVIGHCLSSKTGGFLFFGSDFVPSSRISWTPLLTSEPGQHYKAGPAELLFDGKCTQNKDLEVIFDSGSSYTYLNARTYQSLLELLRKNLAPSLKDVKDPALPVCWKGERPFKSVQDVKSEFKTLGLRFSKGKTVTLDMPPENFLVVTNLGNVCLAILRAGVDALDKNANIIGDISMVDKLVVYDNEKSQIGWPGSVYLKRSVQQVTYSESNKLDKKDSYGIILSSIPSITGAYSVEY